MIKDKYNYKDFFIYLKLLKWKTFETFLILDNFVILNDFYPKAKFHFLILPINRNINNLLELNIDDL